MNTGPIRPGDIVLCDVRGREFHAIFRERDTQGVLVDPLIRGINYHHVKPNQVVAHWRRSKASRR